MPPDVAELVTILPNFPRAEVVVVGDLVADEYVYGETERISREAPVLIVRYESSELKAGCAGNAARNLCALGVKVRVVGLVGDDALGAALLEVLAEGDAGVSGVQRLKGRATEAKTRILAGGRSTRRQQMLRLDRAPQPVPPAVMRRLVRDLETAARGADAVLASDYGSGVLAHDTIEALRRLKRRGTPVCVDSRYQLSAFGHLTMVKPNEPELEAATGIALGSPGGLERAARSLLRRLRCEEILVTRGRNGMSLFRRGERPVHIAAHGSHDAVDVTGAGDTVAAAFCASVAAGASPVAAAHIANVAGALVVQKPGTATVSREEILAELLRA
ncbi:MAG TPA: PfkB family carbohydrate kinase [Anaeromyxobacteraceae bacterium]|nr:PfkB family carbohydrate kinase [Anaeromyxobacteraceae bacterium]